MTNDKCKQTRKFDGHWTPECINNHGNRINGNAKVKDFKFCPFCGKETEIVIPGTED